MDAGTETLDRLYRSHHRQVLAYCHRRLPPVEADDAAADTFVLAMQSRDGSPAPDTELVWLYQIAHRLIEGRGRWDLRIANAGTLLIRRESDEETVAAVQRLHHGDRDVLLLHSWEHLPPDKIALVLGITEEEVNRRMARADQDLIHDLQAANPVPDVDRIPNPAISEHDHLTEIERRLASGVVVVPGVPGRAALVAVAAIIGFLALTLAATTTDWLKRPDPVQALTVVETVELFLDRFEAGDVPGTLDLLSPDAFYVRGGGASAVSYEGPFFTKADNVIEHTSRSYRWYSQHASLNADCRRVFGQVVSCVLTPSGLLSLLDDTGTPTLVRVTIEHFTVEDGLISQWVRATDPVLDERLKSEYEAWLESTDPAAHSELFFLGSLVILDFDDAQRHRDLIAQWDRTR